MHRLLILLVLGVDLVRDCSSQLRCTNSSGQGVYVWSGSKTGKAQCEQMFSALPPKNGHRATTAACPFRVESRCGAVALGRTYLLPPLSSGGALVVPPWLCFHILLIEPNRQISRIRLSDKTS